MIFGIDLGSTKTTTGIWHKGVALLMPTTYGKSKNFYLPPNRPFYEWPYLQKQMVAEFTELKIQAQQYFGQTIENAVLSAPSFFSPVYYNVIRDAGKMAGLNSVWILKQLSAAALCYAYDHRDVNKVILIIKLDRQILEICAAEHGEGVCAIWGYANSKIVGVKEANLVVFLKDYLKSLSLSESDIEEVLFFGEESDIPYLREVVGEVYDCRSKLAIIPETSGARGSILQSAIVNNEMRDILLLDVTPESYGIELKNGGYLKMIPKNTTIPTKRTELFRLDDERLPSQINIYSGENEKASENRFIGTISLQDLVMQSHSNAVEITFDIDPIMKINVAVKSLDNGKIKALTIDSYTAKPLRQQ